MTRMTKISRLNMSNERAGMILVGITRREPEGESNAEINVLAGRCYGIGRWRDLGGPGFGCTVEWIGIDQLGPRKCWAMSNRPQSFAAGGAAGAPGATAHMVFTVRGAAVTGGEPAVRIDCLVPVNVRA
jgi:hypothetical protein